MKKSTILFSLSALCCAMSSAQAQRNLTVYTTDATGQSVADPYTSRNIDMSDAGRFIYAAGPEMNTQATQGTSTSTAIAISDLQLKESDFVVSAEFGVLVEDEPNVDISPDGRYAVLRPSSVLAAAKYSSAAAPLYLYDTVNETLTPIIKSHDGSALTGCSNEWTLHNRARSSFAYWRNEVVYQSTCSNIVADDTNGVSDLFVYNLSTGQNKRLSQVVQADGSLQQIDGSALYPEVDDSGRYVVFASNAENLTDTSCGGVNYYAYVLDRASGSYTRLSACHEGKSNASDLGYAISGNGAQVVVNGNEIGSTSPVQSTLISYDTATATRLSSASYFRRGQYSLSYNGDWLAFISNAFYDQNGVLTANISAFGSFTTWHRPSNTLVTRATNFFTDTPVDTFHHDETMISGGGDFVYFAGNSSDFWSSAISGENSYHEFVGNGFARNAEFVTIRGTHNGWSSFSNMRLVGDHQWEGEIVASVAGSLKFDLAGDWSVNYGDNNADGIADSLGANIPFNAAGVYRVRFNDSTHAYTLSALTQPALDQYLAGASVQVSFSCQNGTTTPGQSVYVIGDLAELGAWNKASAVKLNPSSYPTWTGSISVPANTAVAWKCLKRNETYPNAQVVWQGGSNNTFNSGSTQSVSASF